MSGELEPMLQVPEIPTELSYLIHLFSKIGESNYQALAAYMSVTGYKFKRYEVEILRAIEQARNGVTHG